MRRLSILSFLLLLGTLVMAQSNGVIEGLVKAKSDGNPLAGANIVLLGTQKAVVTDAKGAFEINGLKKEAQRIRVSYLGYATQIINIDLKEQPKSSIAVYLDAAYIDSDPVVISATKTEQKLIDVPTRITTLSMKDIQSMPINNIDNALDVVPGVNVSRDGGLLSHKSIVSMRGAGGSSQARVLVLLDGMPLNKADGGSVNWNMINPEAIGQMEVVKGPNSSLYGGYAMGGIINLISKKPVEKFTGSLGLNYGSMNTMSGNLNVSGRLGDGEKGFYWGVDAFARQSEGYVRQTEEELDEYSIAADMKEYYGGVKLGYDFNRNNSVEVNISQFDDDRGNGTKIYDERGNNFQHGSSSANIRYQGRNGESSWDASAFYRNESMRRMNESIKFKDGEEDYKAYTVESIRKDIGLNMNYSRYFGNYQEITGGVDFKNGSVDGNDVYITSPDVVTNLGSMNNFAAYLQDEISLLNQRLKITAGLRYDLAMFYDGSFTITDATKATSILEDLVNPELDEYQWSHLSPKVSVQYKANPFRVYASYGRGFRPAILDDLCRSGFIAGGFKRANPELNPETLDNVEFGFDLTAVKNLKLTASAFYSMGKDFMYYVGTGDSIAMGSRMRPIREMKNISQVNIYGAEVSAGYQLFDAVYLTANYAYYQTEITEYNAAEGESDLTGLALTYVPVNQISFGAKWLNPYVNLHLYARYKDDQYMDDLNTEMIEAHTIYNAKIWHDFKHLTISAGVNNITNHQYIDSHGFMSIGRFYNIGVKARI